LLRRSNRGFRSARRSNSPASGQSRPLRLEPLEDRLAPAVLSVTAAAEINTALTASQAGTDLGPSLRSAVTPGNAGAGGNPINFTVSSTGANEDGNPNLDRVFDINTDDPATKIVVTLQGFSLLGEDLAAADAGEIAPENPSDSTP
jgi:hypothetical protein